MLNNTSTEKYIDIGIPFSYWGNEIEVICPSCQSTALVKRKQNTAKFACSTCCKNDEKIIDHYPPKRWGEKEVDPFFNLKLSLIESTPHGNIWVYNADQLSHLKSYISAKLREKKDTDKYFDYYVSYFHKLPAWVKAAKNRDMVIKKITRLENKIITKQKNKTPHDIACEVKESFFYRWNWETSSNWKTLDYAIALSSHQSTCYPDFNKKIITIRNIEENKMLIKEAYIEKDLINNKKQLIAELSLKTTTKGSTFRHTHKSKPTKYFTLIARNLNNQRFTAKELITDVADMEIDKNISISTDMLDFRKDDYIYKFIESNHSHSDFSSSSDELQIYYGFSQSALKKVVKSVIYSNDHS